MAESSSATIRAARGAASAACTLYGAFAAERQRYTDSNTIRLVATCSHTRLSTPTHAHATLTEHRGLAASVRRSRCRGTPFPVLRLALWRFAPSPHRIDRRLVQSSKYTRQWRLWLDRGCRCLAPGGDYRWTTHSGRTSSEHSLSCAAMAEAIALSARLLSQLWTATLGWIRVLRVWSPQSSSAVALQCERSNEALQLPKAHDDR